MVEAKKLNKAIEIFLKYDPLLKLNFEKSRIYGLTNRIVIAPHDAVTLQGLGWYLSNPKPNYTHVMDLWTLNQ